MRAKIPQIHHFQTHLDLTHPQVQIMSSKGLSSVGLYTRTLNGRQLYRFLPTKRFPEALGNHPGELVNVLELIHYLLIYQISPIRFPILYYILII